MKNKKKIELELPKASFIDIPGYAVHIGFWLSNKFIYPSQKFENQVAIGIIKTNSYRLIKYLKDQNNTNIRNDWKVLTGKEVILLFEKEKQQVVKRFGRNIKVPTLSGDTKLEQVSLLNIKMVIN